MSAMHAGPSGTSGAGWDEQIVPALRKRLESESAYLSNRMSGASFPDPAGQMESSSSSGPRRTEGARTRTTSSRYAPHEAPSTPSRAALSASSPPAGAGASRSAPRPSRIPMRPRSKSNLSSSTRPEIDLGSAPPVPDLPSQQRPRSGRGSPDLKSALVEVQLKDELPPFRLKSDEAMRIAEKGHDLLDSDEEADQLAIAQAQRKRRETMRQTSGGSRPVTGTGRERKASGMSRSATGDVGLGLGVPPSHHHQSTGTRASSSRPARSLHPSAPVSSSTPRSASLNMLASASAGHSPSSASSARLGMAAHLVPSESTYTPPKGQNWDEVVLPTVAKKLGLNDSMTSSNAGTSEGDLAVEWDTSGTPVKWIKKESVSRLGGPSRALKDTGLTTDDYITRTPTPASTNKSGTGKSAFSPTFEPSPDNPLAPAPPVIRNRPSQNSLGTPIRTSSGQYTPLGGRGSPPPSPAPFSQMQPNPNAYPPARPVRPVPSQSSLGRKNSTLRKPVSPLPLPSPSASDPRLGQRGGPGDRYFSNPRPAPIAQASASGVYDGQPRPRPVPSSGEGPAMPSGRKQGGEGDHGKGCGCMIM